MIILQIFTTLLRLCRPKNRALGVKFTLLKQQFIITNSTHKIGANIVSELIINPRKNVVSKKTDKEMNKENPIEQVIAICVTMLAN